jgi:hypothetical protein
MLRAKLLFSKIAMQSGQIVSTKDFAKDESQLEPRDYGVHIPTLNAISERGGLG